MTSSSSKILRIFAAGALAALPLMATVLLLIFFVRLIIDWLGPTSFFGRALSAIGLGLGGSEWVGYLLGLAVAAATLFGLGLLVEKGLQRGLASVINALVQRIPVVRTIYDTIRNFVELLSKRDESALKTMRPVWCHFGGRGGVAALALLSSPETVDIDGSPCYAVIVPTAPVPIGGGLLYVPKDWISPAEVSMEALTSIYVSMGMTSPQYLKR
jgi:uncharacterized membrane protein